MGFCGALRSAHQLGENGAAPNWQMTMTRGGTNERFGVSQQAAKATNARNKNEPIRTHTHRVMVLRDSSSSMTSMD